VYVLDDGEAYGRALADSFEAAAKKLGLSVLGRESWDPSLGATYEKQFQAIAARKPDLIFAGGLIGSNGGRLIQDKVTILGPNTGNVKMLAPDGFAEPSTIVDAGAGDADGLYISAPTLAADSLRGAGRSFVEGFARSEHLSPGQLQPYAIYAAEAAEVMIDAIKRSDGTRAGVLQALLRTSIPNGILGQVRFDAHGDPLAPQITISRVVAGALRWMTQVAPPAALIRAAA
jgi:branched-chain amino acid transport system substrate-binding protein